MYGLQTIGLKTNYSVYTVLKSTEIASFRSSALHLHKRSTFTTYSLYDGMVTALSKIQNRNYTALCFVQCVGKMDIIFNY